MNQIVNGLHGTQAVLMRGDCLERMKEIPEGSVDMVFCDLPYGSTSCKWDICVCLGSLKKHFLSTCRPSGAWLFSATQPFASEIINSMREFFKYDLIWFKNQHSSPFFAKHQPLRQHEHVLVMGDGKIPYNPQMGKGKPYCDQRTYAQMSSLYRGEKRKRKTPAKMEMKSEGERYPISVLRINGDSRFSRYHPTQKPVALLEWLIRTYTNPGDTVLDPTAGSGTTAVAALNTGRNAICIEKDPTYFDVMCKRVRESQVPAAQTELALG